MYKKTIEETNRGKSLPEQRTKHSISTFWNHFFSIFGSIHSLLLSLRINGHTHISYILAYTDERRTHRRRRTMETNEQNEQTELVEGSQEGHLGSEYPLVDTCLTNTGSCLTAYLASFWLNQPNSSLFSSYTAKMC